MRLYQLHYACRLYQGEFDRAYNKMCETLGPNPDLASEAQRDGLVQFLNDWGCRIPKNNFPAIKEHIQQWASQWITQLPDASRDVRSLSGHEHTQIGEAFQVLLDLNVALKFESTATAKTLHALRRHTLPAWDSAIKDWFVEKLGLSRQRSGERYAAFVRHVAEEISELEADAKRHDYPLSNLIHGPDGSLMKLVDEYYWVTLTLGHNVPTRNEFGQWLGWMPN